MGVFLLNPKESPHIVLACKRRTAPPCWLVKQAALRRWTDTGPALAALASTWEEKVRSWVYGIWFTWI